MNGRPLRRPSSRRPPPSAPLARNAAPAPSSRSRWPRYPPCPRRWRRSRTRWPPLSLRDAKMSRLSPIASRSRVSPMKPDMESVSLKVKRLPRMRSSGINGAAIVRRRNRWPAHPPHHQRAGIELALPAFIGIVARLADNLHMLRTGQAPSAPSRSARTAAPDAAKACESPVRPAAVSPDRARSTLPSASRMPPGTGGRSPLTRAIASRRVDALFAGRRRAAMPIARRPRRAFRASHTSATPQRIRSCRHWTVMCWKRWQEHDAS